MKLKRAHPPHGFPYDRIKYPFSEPYGTDLYLHIKAGCLSHEKQPDILSEQPKHYADPNDYNRIFYHQRNDDMEAIIKTLLTDSDCLLDLCKTDFENVTEYQLFIRCLSDQTVVESGKRRMRTKQDGTMNSSALQNPSDPDATCRNKAGKQYRGYSANIEETVGKMVLS